MLKPISAVEEFEARLKKSLLNSVQPFVGGVRMESICDDDSSGYVKVLIPRSDKVPHRAMRADREYFRRSTEGFYRLEHFDLEDLFGRRPHPSLAMDIKLVPRVGDDPYEEVRFAVLNQGRGIARYIGAMCEFSADVEIASVDIGWTNVTRLNNGRPIATYSDNTGIIHPVSITFSIGRVTVKRPSKGVLLPLTLLWYCEGMVERSFSGTILPENIANEALHPTAESGG